MNDGNFIVGEAEYKELSQFLEEHALNKKKNNSIFSLLSEHNYSVHSLRTKSFNSIENYFVLVREKEIKSAIAIGGLYQKNGTVNLNAIIFYNENKAYNKVLFEYLIEIMKKMGIFKIKFCTYSLDVEREDILCELGFIYETKLVKEDDGKDILIFSYII